jgi:glycosyltransferase involved in cell wall biosynthesis
MTIELSVVSPMYNEEGNIQEFLRQVVKSLQKLEAKYEYEIVLIDDGSIDGTWQKVLHFATSELAPKNISIRAIKLAANYGQMSALDAGLRAAKGTYILTMDCDLQHPPEIIGDFFISRFKAPVVLGVQVHREDNSIKGYLSSTFYRLLKSLSGVPIVHNGGDFRLISRKILEQLLSIHDNHSVIRFAIARLQLPIYRIEFASKPRLSGSTKYSLRKMSKLALASVLTLTTRPLRLSVYFTIAFGTVFAIESAYILYSYSLNNTIPGWASLGLLISFGFFTVSFNSMIQAIFIARIFESSQNFPRSVISEEI